MSLQFAPVFLIRSSSSCHRINEALLPFSSTLFFFSLYLMSQQFHYIDLSQFFFFCLSCFAGDSALYSFLEIVFLQAAKKDCSKYLSSYDITLPDILNSYNSTLDLVILQLRFRYIIAQIFSNSLVNFLPKTQDFRAQTKNTREWSTFISSLFLQFQVLFYIFNLFLYYILFAFLYVQEYGPLWGLFFTKQVERERES